MLYEPQVEQFGIALEPCGDALAGRASTDDADAAVFVYRIDGCCVVTSHRVLVRRDMPFFEQSVPGLCVCTLSRDSLALCPVAPPRRSRPHGNVAIFGDGAMKSDRSILRAGTRQDATSIMLLPRWFDRLDGRARHAARALMEEPGDTCIGDTAAALDRTMRALTPLFGGRLANLAMLHAHTGRAALTALGWYLERTRAEAAAGTREQRQLVRSVQCHVGINLDKPLSLDQLARDLLTSRTRLCAAFKQETGESLGAYIRRTRMERAAELLDNPRLDIAAIACAVGYPRTSSFTVAFEHAFGCSPTAFRARCGGALGRDRFCP